MRGMDDNGFHHQDEGDKFQLSSKDYTMMGGCGFGPPTYILVLPQHANQGWLIQELGLCHDTLQCSSLFPIELLLLWAFLRKATLLRRKILWLCFQLKRAQTRIHIGYKYKVYLFIKQTFKHSLV
jgi:hypothetical protein